MDEDKTIPKAGVKVKDDYVAIPKHLKARVMKEIVESDEEVSDDESDDESEDDSDDTAIGSDDESESDFSEVSYLSEVEDSDDDDAERMAREKDALEMKWEGQGQKNKYFEDYLDQAMELRDDGRYEEAVLVLNEATEKHPEDYESLSLRLELYTLLGYGGKEMKQLTRAVSALKEKEELDDYVVNYSKDELYGDEEVSSDEEDSYEDSDDEWEVKEIEDEETAYVPVRERRSRACKQRIKYFDDSD
jgi:tetratricopeptide (TPR) repeat protein